MLRHIITFTALGSITLANAAAAAASCNDVLSCSPEALKGGTSACCVPTPAGLFVFRQRFEPDIGGDMGSWGIDGLDVLE